MIAYAFHPEAEAELGNAASFYEARLDGLGKSFIDAVERAIVLIRRYREAVLPLTDLDGACSSAGFRTRSFTRANRTRCSFSPWRTFEGAQGTGGHGHRTGPVGAIGRVPDEARRRHRSSQS